MFSVIGKAIARAWPVVLVIWLALLGVSQWQAPKWSTVAEDKEFAFLPTTSPSRVAEDEFRKAFPEDQLDSNIVLVLTNDGQPHALQAGRDFIENALEPELRKIAEQEGGLASEANAASDDNPFAPPQPAARQQTSIIARIRTPNAPGIGALLESDDGRALLVVMELTTEFLSSQNWPTINKVQGLVESLERDGKVPADTKVYITGSAVLGRDHSVAELKGARATEWLTIVMVIGLLVLIYRAPLLALIPLLTVYLSVRTSLSLLAIMAARGYLTLFQGIQVFITVLVYGAGVDYCLFLMARYKEELDDGHNARDAVSGSIGRVGAALAASAFTVICGIGMMVFAQFGKFRQAGMAIPFCLFIALCATLTFSAALLPLAGRWAFWPYGSHEAMTTSAPHHSASRLSIRRRYLQAAEFYRGWEWVAHLILRHPARVWTITVALMAPFAIIGVIFTNRLTYDVVSNLPPDDISVRGVQALKQHFPEGILGPVTVLLIDPELDFRTDAGHQAIQELTDSLRQKRDELGIADIRSLTRPLGIHVANAAGFSGIELTESQKSRAIETQALEHYTTDLGGRKRVGTRLDIVLQHNPFSREAVSDLERLEKALENLPGALAHDTSTHVLGATASIRDLRDVHDSDHTRISLAVLGGVFVILVLLLRQPVLCAYLVLSVLFSYYATFGATYLLFWALDPHGFLGLDWKVSTFLFTILIAVGEDYNIFLMARVHEEQRRHGPFRGILCAMTRTGPIISSCGIIMAGTFGSLLAGTLSEMKQLGVALALGVLIDTFVVRPILVPAFLVLMEQYRYRGYLPDTAAAEASSKPAC